jgi:hypothetical protein
MTVSKAFTRPASREASIVAVRAMQLAFKTESVFPNEEGITPFRSAAEPFARRRANDRQILQECS